MKLGQLIKFHTRNISLQKSRQKKNLKGLIWRKSKWYEAWFQYILIITQLGLQQSKLCKTLDYWSRYMLNFSEKGLALVSPPHFVNDFSGKMFLVLYSITWRNFIVWLPCLPEILNNICFTKLNLSF